MGGYEQQIMQYSTGFAVCLGILIAAASLAVFFGIRFRILHLAVRMIGRKGKEGGRRKVKKKYIHAEKNTVFLIPQQEKDYEKTAPINSRRKEPERKETKGRGS